MAPLFESSHPIKRLQRAEELFMRGSFTEAAHRFRRLRHDALAGTSARRRLAHIALLANRSTSAEQMLGQTPHDPELLRLAGALFRRSDRLGHAATCMRALGNDTLAHALLRLAGEAAPVVEAAGTVELSTTDPLPLLPVRVNGRETRFLLDTASQEVVIDQALADELSLWQSGRQTATFAGGGLGEITYGRVERLEMGDWHASNLPIQIQPLRKIFREMLGGTRVEGILGTSFLSRLGRVEIDFARGRIRRMAGAAGSARFWLADAFLPLVRATLNGRITVPMLLDTGQQAFAVAVATDIARTAGLPMSDLPLFGEGGGGRVALLPTRIGRLEMAGRSYDEPPAVCMPRFPLEYRFGFRLGGLIGYELLKRSRLELDFYRMRMRITEVNS